tara:strand:+ start:983 stop:1324 length:342 start_codon:yes stop_codon:yes gene_type:complete
MNVWWIATLLSICIALLIQYYCASKLLRVKQQIALKNSALREAREENSRLADQEISLKNQQKSLEATIERLRSDIKRLGQQLKDKSIPIPDPDFDLSILDFAEASSQDPESTD